MEYIFDKFESEVFKKMEKENLMKIVSYLNKQGIDYIEDIIEDYLDLFLIDYDVFVSKFEMLNNKYQGNLVNMIYSDMGVLEQFFY